MIDYSIQKKESPEVYLSNQSSLSIDAFDMYNLVNLAKELPRNRIRYCAHSSPSDALYMKCLLCTQKAHMFDHTNT